MDIQKESLQTPAALFHHLHKRSLVSLASVVMPCSGLIAATEFQAWLKEEKNTAHAISEVLCPDNRRYHYTELCVTSTHLKHHLVAM